MNCHWFVSCLTHIINMATQALLAAHSKSKHYDPDKLDEPMVGSRGVNMMKLDWSRQFVLRFVTRPLDWLH